LLRCFCPVRDLTGFILALVLCPAIKDTTLFCGKGLYLRNIWQRRIKMANIKLEEAYIPLQCMIINSLAEFSLEDIANAQFYILERLNNKGSRTAKEIAEERGITQAAISKLNKKLLEKALSRKNEA